MIKKKRRVLSFLILSLIVSGLLFTLSSKGTDIDDIPDPVYCEELEGTAAQIQINFHPTSHNAYRASGYVGYIPTPDLRTSGNPAGTSAEADKYYCIVTVTTPQCSDWIWERALTLNNSNGTGKMDVMFTPADQNWDTVVRVTYYEIMDFPTTPINFNSSGSAMSVEYVFEHQYQGIPTVPQPIQLYATGTVVRGVPGDGGKNYNIGDYGNVNDYLDYN